MIVTRRKRIGAGGTVAIWGSTIVLKQLVIVVSDPGTSWKIRIEDNSTTPAIIVPPITLTAPSTLAWVYQHFREGLPMQGGMDFVTESGTFGALDIWFSFEQPST